MDALISKNKGDEDGVTTLLLAGDAYEEAPKSQNAEDETKLSDIKYFPMSFWILVVSCLVVYGK